MPVTPTYPGVYMQEIPSGVRTITGVATSIAAFVGRALRGPVNQPTTVSSYAEFERAFGGLWVDGPLTYAVRDFFLNGGGQAIIVRLYGDDGLSAEERATARAALQSLADTAGRLTAGDQLTPAAVETALSADLPAPNTPTRGVLDRAVADAKAAASKPGASPASIADALTRHANVLERGRRARLRLGDLQLEAANEGAWGNGLQARVDHQSLHLSGGAEAAGLTEDDLLNLTLHDSLTGVSEVFRNVSLKGGPRRLDNVLASGSRLARVVGALPASRVAESDDLLRRAEIALSTPQGETTRAAITQAELQSLDAPLGINQADLTDDELKAARLRGVKAALRGDPFKSALRFAGVASGDRADNGAALGENDYVGPGKADQRAGLYALDDADLFNLLCIPPDTREGSTPATVLQAALAYCYRRRAVLIVDPPADWDPLSSSPSAEALGLVGPEARNAALYYPRIVQADPLREGQSDTFVPCGVVAGVIARTDSQRGIWKAPAGIDAALSGIQGLARNLTDADSGRLNPYGINCLRVFPAVGPVIWGARTLRGADQLADEYKYLPVRRLALYIQESLYRGLQWAVFEPNDEALWSQLRLNVGAFMHNLFRQSAFQGRAPREAYFVQCDKDTTTQNDINQGLVNVVVGFAPLKPAEFVIVSLQQMAGQVQA